MSDHTPGPWVGFCDDGQLMAIMPAMREGDVCTFRLPPSEADGRLMIAAPELLGALLLLTGNPYIDLGDLVYEVREREGKGWDGPAVLAWGQAVDAAKVALAKAAVTS